MVVVMDPSASSNIQMTEFEQQQQTSPDNATASFAAPPSAPWVPDWFHGTRREPMVLVPCALIAVLFLAINLSYTQRRYGPQASNADAEGLIPRLSTLVIQTTDELIQSTTYLGYRNSSQTDRQLAFPLLATQTKTLELVLELQGFFRDRYSDSTADTSPGVNPYYGLPFAPLRSLQYQVLQRSARPLDVIEFFDEFRGNALSLLSFYASKEVPDPSRRLYAAVRASAMRARNALDRVAAAQTEALNQAAQSSLTTAARSTFDNRYLRRQLLPLLSNVGDATARATADEALSLTATMDNIYRSYAKTGVWDVQAAGPTTPTETLAALTRALRRIQQRYETSGFTKVNSDETNYRSIVLASTITGLLVVVLLLVVRRAIQAAVQEGQDATETSQMLALEASYERMVHFLDSIKVMRVEGIQASEGKNVQTVERDVYALEAPTKQLLAFLHPALPFYRAQRSSDAFAVVASSSGAGGEDVAATNGVAELPPASAAAVATRRAGAPSFSLSEGGEIIPRKVYSATVSLVAIDLDGWQNRITSESAKLMPREFARFVNRVTQVVQQHNGVVHDVSGSKMFLVWNLRDDCHETETMACQCVLAIHKALAAEYPLLRYGVATGDCSVGVVGTETLKTFICVGPILALAGLLLKLNRMHGTACIVDDTTFAKLDGQTFRTRPLEVVAVDPQSRRTVGFELMVSTSPTDKDGRNASWNEAFDEYKSGNFDRAKQLFRKWQATFGESRSIARLLALITEDPPRQCTFKHNDDGLIEDELI